MFLNLEYDERNNGWINEYGFESDSSFDENLSTYGRDKRPSVSPPKSIKHRDDNNEPDSNATNLYSKSYINKFPYI